MERIRKLIHEIFMKRAYSALLHCWKRENPCKQVSSREDLHRYIGALLDPKTPIEYLEFGVYRGATIELWSRIHASEESVFVGFDSFQGLPETWNDTYSAGHFSTMGQAPTIDDDRVRFEAGWFHETLPSYLDTRKASGQLVVHLDADLYSSTLYALTRLAPYLRKGAILLFDDFLYATDVFRALRDFQNAYPVELEAVAQAPSRKGTPFAQVAMRVVDVSSC